MQKYKYIFWVNVPVKKRGKLADGEKIAILSIL